MKEYHKIETLFERDEKTKNLLLVNLETQRLNT